MNAVRIVINILLSCVLLGASIFLLLVDDYTLHGIRFAGVSRYLLAMALISVAGFSGAVAWGWVTGSLPKPPKSTFRFDPTYVDPTYKGELFVRYWYFIAPFVACLLGAVWLAKASGSP